MEGWNRLLARKTDNFSFLLYLAFLSVNGGGLHQLCKHSEPVEQARPGQNLNSVAHVASTHIYARVKFCPARFLGVVVGVEVRDVMRHQCAELIASSGG